jgi:membrane protease YdiL (CAAX protease family)
MDEEEEDTPRPFGVLAASLWCIVSAIAMTVVVAVFEGIRPGAASDLVTLTLARVLTVGAIVLAVSRIHAPDASFGDLLGAEPPKASHVVIALALGLSLCVCLGFVDERLAAAYPQTDEADHALTEKLLAAPSSGRAAFLLLALMVVLPVCHELLFRGLVFTGLLLRSGGGVGIVRSAVAERTLGGKPAWDAAITTVLLEILTVGLSGDVRGLGSTIAFAAAATYVRLRSRSLYPAIAMHVAYYASVVAVVWKPAWAEHDIPRMWAAGAAVVALLCIALFRSATQSKVLEPVSE